MLHSCKGSIQDNEDTEEVLQMENSSIILNALLQIKDLSIQDAKKE
jgi:hypothetical protein